MSVPRTIRIRQLAVLVSALVVALAHAGSTRELKWEDLIPPMPINHPLAKLTRYQGFQLGQVATLRERQARGEKLSPLEMGDLKKATHSLKKTGFDIDQLLALRKEVARRDQARVESVNPALNGQVVRLPGYLLPLEFSGKEITEFLLVPWVGACIHTPPPPPNQIVHVKSLKPIGNLGLFDPIWVTGRLSTASGKTNLYLVDGAADINTGYSLQATQVERYNP